MLSRAPSSSSIPSFCEIGGTYSTNNDGERVFMPHSQKYEFQGIPLNKFGGFVDEDDSDSLEWGEAESPQRSATKPTGGSIEVKPVRGNVSIYRVSCPHKLEKSIAKINRNVPEKRLKNSAPVRKAMAATSKRQTITMSDLPNNSQKRFTQALVPRLRDYMGTVENPWDIDGSVVDVIQELWDTVFPDIAHEVQERDDAVYYMVK